MAQTEIKMAPLQMDFYGCVLCQQTHYADDPLYQEHIYHQSKHGIQRGPKPGYFAPEGPDTIPPIHGWRVR